MKKLIITCALITSASLVASAQTVQQPATAPAAGIQAAPRPQMTLEQQAERRAKGQEKALNLTAEQYKTVYEAELEWMQKADALKKTGKATRDEFAALNDAKIEKVKKVLTPEQQSKYAVMTNRQHPPVPMVPGSQPVPPAPAK